MRERGQREREEGEDEGEAFHRVEEVERGKLRGGVAELVTNAQCPTMVNAINDNGNGRESRAEVGLELSFALVDTGGIGSWWTLLGLCALCVLCV